jgi:hypothetical protein
MTSLDEEVQWLLAKKNYAIFYDLDGVIEIFSQIKV